MNARRVPAILSALLLFSACDRRRDVPAAAVAPFTPSATSRPQPPGQANAAYWVGDAVVLSAVNSGRACGWGTAPGETRAGVSWLITRTGDSILLEEDMSNWPTDHIPYNGTLTGLQFTASYSGGSDYLRWVCQFKGGSLSGRFSADLSSFEALETLTWGPPGNETTVQRRWTGTPFSR